MKKTLSLNIVQSHDAIENAMAHPEILAKLSVFGYDLKTLRRGKATCEKVSLLQMIQQEKYSFQYDATDTLNDQFEVAQKVYDKHMKLARVAFEGKRGMLEKLQLNGPRKKGQGWVVQAMAFYGRATEIEEIMTVHGVPADVLNQAKAMVEALSTLRQQQLQKMGEAQSATHKRDMAIKAMDKWMGSFRRVARVALEEDPQLLEVLGIKVPSKKV